MSSEDIIDGTKFNGKTGAIFTAPKVNASGGKNIGILNANTKRSLHISTPLMLTWGVNEYRDEKTGKISYDMSLQFPNDEYNTEQLTAFLKNMQEFESHVKESAIANSKEWMNKAKMSTEVVDALFTPLLKYPKDKNTGDFDYSRAPTLRVKIPYWDGVFKNVEIYNTNSDLLFPLPNSEEQAITDYISKGSNVATIIQCGGVWFANGKFGVTWKLFQCVVKPKQSLNGKCHISLTESDLKKIVVDSDNEDDVDEEMDTTPPPSSPIKKVKEDSKEEAKEEEAKEEAKEVTVDENIMPVKKKKVVKKKPVATEEA